VVHGIGGEARELSVPFACENRSTGLERVRGQTPSALGLQRAQGVTAGKEWSHESDVAPIQDADDLRADARHVLRKLCIAIAGACELHIRASAGLNAAADGKPYTLLIQEVQSPQPLRKITGKTTRSVPGANVLKRSTPQAPVYGVVVFPDDDF